MTDHLWLQRVAEVLCCEDIPSVVVVAIEDLRDELHNAKKMIAHLRGENARLRGESFTSEKPAIVAKAEVNAVLRKIANRYGLKPGEKKDGQ